jgi:anionic cell wall polymer biosynthesis LytR-Cps2A-Psr (LCP) family protein
MAVSMEHRINFIDNEISKITDEPLLKDIKQLPSVSRTNLINILAVANSDEKRKILSVLRDLTVDEQIEVIVLLNSL